MRRREGETKMNRGIIRILPLLIPLVGLIGIFGSGHGLAETAPLESYRYRLIQSLPGLRLWTAPPSERVFKKTAVPTETSSEVKIYCARNEREPFQVVVRPDAPVEVRVSVHGFGKGIETELHQVKYVYIDKPSDNLGRRGYYPDPLWPLENGASARLPGKENTAFWITVSVTKAASAGDYTGSVQVGNTEVPVRLHVFDFAIPDELHVHSQMNFSYQTLLSHYGVSGTGDDYWMYVNKIKQYFIDHRLTPSSVLWPGGVTSNGGSPFIDYDCKGKLTDPHGIWGFEEPASKYLDGRGFNGGTGFPSFMAVAFRNNDASADQRPDSFCGVARTQGDWYATDNPDSPYNRSWLAYMKALQDYLDDSGYLEKAYYYFANEPQDQEDYDAVAWYSRIIKKAAPRLKLMVSEEPKPEIFDHPLHAAKIDIWLPVLNNFDPVVSHEREKNHGEETWVYFLHGTRPPFLNPVTLDHPGIEARLTGWLLWKYRIRGIAYYSLNDWSRNPWTSPATDSHNGDTFMLYPPSEDNTPIAFGVNHHRFVPSIRFELLRDGLEDYEYLHILAGGRRPEVGMGNASDPQVDKMIAGLTSYTRDERFAYNLRRLVGLKNGNEISSIPDIHPPPTHPRARGKPGSYHLNFQDPRGKPEARPLVVNNHKYMKIGWSQYDAGHGYGWYGDMAHVMYQYLQEGPNELQKSVIYDDWGRQHTFEFDLPNGTYKVTLSVGWEGRVYSHNHVVVEGNPIVEDEASSPYIVRTKEVAIQDNKLTMEVGIFDEYTMLNYMDIEAVKTPGPH